MPFLPKQIQFRRIPLAKLHPPKVPQQLRQEKGEERQNWIWVHLDALGATRMPCSWMQVHNQGSGSQVLSNPTRIRKRRGKEREVTFMPWLHQGPDSQTKSCQTEPDKKLLVLSGFLDQKFEGKLKEAGQIESDNTRFCLFLYSK